MRFTRLVFPATIAVFAVSPGLSQAQDGYLFRAPRVTISIRAGAELPTANDDLFRFFTNELTLSRRDFASTMFGLDVAVAVSPRVDLVGSISRARIDRQSEFRDWVDANEETIDQSTRLKRLPVTIGARFLARERGRSVGKFAWVPRSVLPYAGAAVGVIWYNLEQEGWFVDSETLDIFPDYFQSLGNAPMGQVFGGTEWWPKTFFGLTIEGKYTYAKASLRQDFQAYERMDLSGFQLSAGIAARF